MFAFLYQRVVPDSRDFLAQWQTHSKPVLPHPGHAAAPRGFCVQIPGAATTALKAGRPYHCPVTGRCVLAWLRLDNRDDLAAQLGLGAVDDMQILLAAYDRWHTDCVRHLIGDFAFALYDPRSQTVMLARDPVGVRPLYYRLDADLLAVSMAPAALLALPGRSATRDMDWAARFLMHLSMSHSATGYREIKKLPPGHVAVLSSDSLQIRSYFSWQDDAPASRQRDPRWVAAYRERLQQAIACRLEKAQDIGCENSGGIDSATVTGCAAQLAGSARLHTFGFAILPQEASHILATSQMHQIQHNHIFTRFATLADADIDRILDVLAYPAEHGNGPGHLPFYQLCQRFGVTSLLSGFGGDEVVTNPGYHLIHELIDQRDWRNLWHVLPGNPAMRSLRLGKRLLQQRPATFNPRFMKAWQQRWSYQPLRNEVVAQLDLQTEYLATASYDAPYRRINDFALKNRLSASFIPTRLENCSLVAAMSGVDYRWPLLDVRLIQQYLSTPSLEKYGPNGMGRYLHRRAMEGMAPAMVQWKVSKDMGMDTYSLQRRAPEQLQAIASQLLTELERVGPELDTLLDTARIRQAAHQLPKMQGEELDAAMMMLQRTGKQLHWLNRWLVRPQ
ncbi:MAG: asparagine synthase-related protein [Undibacterium sp.]|uniref:asparagine synthetase B family protein n=1 Tax=Undibacterium sp. TaxID=1914977 RepID=UPI002718DCFC|nr:asparagine synthase-related protein [Undibacterium sp.]MDO8652616.1 asparagine synthase-related protein [Undibacterium sp.]